MSKLQKVPMEMLGQDVQDKFSNLSKGVSEYEWTATVGQVTYVLPSGQTYDTTSKWLEVFVGGAPIPDSQIQKDNSTQFTLLIDSSKIQAGMIVIARWTQPYIPATSGHNSTHLLGGTDEIDITKLRNFNEQVAIPLAQKVYYYNTVSAMVAANLKVGDAVKTLGYYSSGDGGGASYTIVAGGTGTADGGSFINLTNGLQAEIIEVSYTNVRQFGAKGDGATDDSSAFIANLAWGGLQKQKIRVPWGSFYINQKITINSQCVEGDGYQRSRIIMGTNGYFYVQGTRSALKDMEIHGQSSSSYSPLGIEVNGATHSIFSGLEMYWFTTAIQVDANTWSNTFEDIQAYYNTTCLYLNGDQINDTNFIACQFENSSTGVQAVSGSAGFHYKINFYGCHFELNANTGAYINANGSYSFHGTYFERNNTSNQQGETFGGLVIDFSGTSGARPSTIDIIGCYHIQSNVRIKQEGTTTTTLLSNYFKDIQLNGQYAVELLNPTITTTNKVLNINPMYEMVNSVTNKTDMLYSLNSNGMYGSTSQRPVNATGGQMYFDSTLLKPVWCRYGGTQEVDKFQITAGATTSGNITITLNGTATTVAVSAGDTIASVASKINATSISGWSTSLITTTTTNDTVVFTKNTVGSVSAPSFSDTSTTGVAATVTRATTGLNAPWLDATGASV